MKGEVVAITGASSGLGAALSRMLAKKGYRLVLGGRSKGELDEFAAELKDLAAVETAVIDVRKKSDCENFINAAVERFGRIDILINNAGIWRKAGIDEATEKDIRDMFDTNAIGPIFCSQAAIKIMRKQKSGQILNIGSTAVVDNKSSHVAYGASKSALVGFTGCLRTELEGTGIRVSVFSPNGIKTNLFRETPKDTTGFMEPDFVAENIIRYIENPPDEWHVIFRNPNKH